MADSIGLCTWIFGHQRHGEIAAMASEMGCEGVELHVSFHEMPATDLRRLYASHGLRILSLTPENVDLIHQDPQQRQLAQQYYSRLIDFAADLEAPAITIHEYVGRGPSTEGNSQQWQWLLKACHDLVEKAATRGVELLLEPMQPPLVSAIHRAADAVRLCEEVGSPQLRVVLDTFHMDATENDVGQAIHECEGRLGAVQLADRNRTGLGLGGLELDNYFRAFRAINFDGPWILECTTGLKGPSLKEQAVDLAELQFYLNTSIKELRRLLSNHPPLDGRPACAGLGSQS